MNESPNSETLQKDCKDVSFDTLHSPGEGGQVVEWKGDALIPLTPAIEEPQPRRQPVTIYIPSMGPRTKRRMELLILTLATLGGISVGLYFGALALIAVFEILFSKDFIKALLAVTAVALLFLMMAVRLTSRPTGKDYTPDDRTSPGWMATRHGGTSRQTNTTIINVTGDSATITTSNNNNA